MKISKSCFDRFKADPLFYLSRFAISMKDELFAIISFNSLTSHPDCQILFVFSTRAIMFFLKSLNFKAFTSLKYSKSISICLPFNSGLKPHKPRYLTQLCLVFRLSTSDYRSPDRTTNSHHPSPKHSKTIL
jgi:hypothetical protein